MSQSFVGQYRTNLEHLRAAQKPSFGTAAYSRHINRPLGRRFAAAFHIWGWTPNQVTVLSAASSAAGLAIVALIRPTWWVGLLVAFLLALGYVLDSVDGQLARLRGGGSKAGEWLDHTVDCFKTASLHLVVLISWFRFSVVPNDQVSNAWMLLPLAFEVVAVTTYFGLMLMPTLRPALPAAQGVPANAQEHPLRKWMLLPTDYGAQCWLFALLGATGLFRWVYLAALVCCAAALAAALRKWWRELQSLDASNSAFGATKAPTI